MRILITGALGYLGSELISRLIDMPIEIIAVDNNINAIENRLGSFLYNPKFSFYNVDVSNKQQTHCPKLI